MWDHNGEHDEYIVCVKDAICFGDRQSSLVFVFATNTAVGVGVYVFKIVGFWSVGGNLSEHAPGVSL